MVGEGREPQKDRISKIYDLADVYHCDNIDRVRDQFIEDANIVPGKFDNIADCGYAIPSHWDIDKVYKRLINILVYNIPIIPIMHRNRTVQDGISPFSN